MWNSLKRLQPYLAPEWGIRVFSYLAMLVLAGTSAAYAALTGPALESLFRGKAGDFDFLPLELLPVAIVAVACVKGVAQTVQFSLNGRMSLAATRRLRDDVFARLLSLSPRFFQAHNTADLVGRMTQDSERVEFAIFYGMVPLVRETVAILVLLIFCIAIDPLMSLFAFIVLPVSALPLASFARWLKRVARRSQDEMSGLGFSAFEAVSGIRTVQAFGTEAYEKRRFAASSERHRHAMSRSYFIRAVRTPTMEVLGAVGVAALIYYLGRSVALHTMDAGHVASFAVAVIQMYDPIKKLGNVGDYLAQGSAALDRMLEVRDAPVEIPSSDGPAPVVDVKGELNVEAVEFAYQDRRLVLQDVTLHVPAGKVCALVGHSGAGKTTMMQLLLRFYDPTRGGILLDGVDLRQWPTHALRRQMAWVSQEVFLFNASVRENLCLGETVSEAQLNEALEAAQAADFVRALPLGIETVLGERGTLLSGGQRQRLAIARAFLRNAPVLLLDEATSALDSESEQAIQHALDRLMVGRTTIVIAHRLSTIRRADMICVMEAGRIVQRGTHDELVSQSGTYQRLAELQFPA